MAKRTSSSTHAILGLLNLQTMTGYELGQAIRASIGHIWSESYGQIYPNLKTLAAAGLIESKTEKQEGKPDRQLYNTTKKGRRELAEWLTLPPQPEIPRNEMLLKLFFGAHTDPSVLIAFVERMVEEHRTLLVKFKQIEEEEVTPYQTLPDAAFWIMTARYGQLEMQAHLTWAEETLTKLHKLARKQDPDRPRKERPHKTKSSKKKQEKKQRKGKSSAHQ